MIEIKNNFNTSNSNLQGSNIKCIDGKCDSLSENESKSKDTLNASIFEGIKLLTVDGKEVLMTDLWKKKAVILKLLPRLGCPLCKKEAHMLSKLQPVFEKYNVEMVAVVFENSSVWEFVESGFWEWKIFMDIERKVYRAANLNRISLVTYLKETFTKRILNLINNLKSNGYKSSLKGDARQLGGTFLINPDGKILYDFRPTKFACFPDLRELYLAVGGDPNEIEQDIPSEYLYTTKDLNNI